MHFTLSTLYATDNKRQYYYANLERMIIGLKFVDYLHVTSYIGFFLPK